MSRNCSPNAHRRLPRNDPTLGGGVRADDRPASESDAPQAAYDVAPRRDVRLHWWQENVSVASCRCRRRGARLSCAIAPEQASRPATDAQAYSQVSHGPFDIRHRQTAFIRGGKSRTAVTDRPRERLATEQPGRELARPSATTGAEDAAVPVSGIGSAVPLGTCFGL